MKASHTIRPVFDDPNLVSAAGLVPALRLAESAGLHDLLDEQLSVASPNATAKATSVVGGMLAGADSIDDLDLLRHGGMPRLFGGVRAPSTLGTFLRSFTHGHVQQLDAVGGRLLARLAGRVPSVIAGGDTADGVAFIDVDDTIREVHGYAKQAASYGYTRVRGLNIQLATVSTPLAAPVIARARLRRGNTASAAGAGRLLAQAIGTARGAGVHGRILCRADSAYYGWSFVGTAIRAKAWFSVTGRMTPSVVAAIAGIGEEVWTPIRYPNAIWEEAEQRWISDAEVAEVPFVAFTGRRKAEHVACRLVVRRVRRLQPLASDGTEQGELFASYRHHAFITNSTLGLVEADQRHRDHAIVEQVIAELKDGPLAHLPSANYAANAAWVALAVVAFNIARATAVAADMAKTRWATPAGADHQHPRPDRGHRPPTHPAPPDPMALGRPVGHPPRDRDRTTNSRRVLTIQPSTSAQPRTRSGRAGTGRQVQHAHDTTMPITTGNDRYEINVGGSGLRGRRLRPAGAGLLPPRLLQPGRLR